jgi:predicted Na+-dependent transporter
MKTFKIIIRITCIPISLSLAYVVFLELTTKKIHDPLFFTTFGTLIFTFISYAASGSTSDEGWDKTILAVVCLFLLASLVMGYFFIKSIF